MKRAFRADGALGRGGGGNPAVRLMDVVETGASWHGALSSNAAWQIAQRGAESWGANYQQVIHHFIPVPFQQPPHPFPSRNSLLSAAALLIKAEMREGVTESPVTKETHPRGWQ